MKRSSLTHTGFTLLEIMLVVAIIGLLAGSAMYFMGDNLFVAQETKVKADIRGISTQLTVYQASNGFLPTTEQGLKALVVKPTTEPIPRNWRQGFTEVPLDSWKQEYHYREPGKHNPNGFDLFSGGKDRKPDTADDIGNWKES